jgi:hypothetical protein
MSANPPKKLPANVTSEPRDIELEEQIRLRAYELYETRGRQDGHEMEDWLQAETELKEKMAHRIAA